MDRNRKPRDWDSIIIQVAFIAALLFVAGSLIYNTGKSCDTTVQFMAVGPNNETIPNATISNSTVLGIKYECTQFCANKFYGDSYKLKDCFAQCNSLI